MGSEGRGGGNFVRWGFRFPFLLRYESYHGGSELITDEFEERGMKKNRNGAGFSENNIVRERGGEENFSRNNVASVSNECKKYLQYKGKFDFIQSRLIRRVEKY